MCLPASLISPLPVRAAKQRVGCNHAGNQLVFRMILLLIARTYKSTLAVGILAHAQWLYPVSRTRLLYRDMISCLYESFGYQNCIKYRVLEHVFERLYRPCTTRTGLQALPAHSESAHAAINRLRCERCSVGRSS